MTSVASLRTIRNRIPGGAIGRPRSRSTILEPPGSSSPIAETCGSCRTRGKRQRRVSHRSLDGAERRAAHRLPRSYDIPLTNQTRYNPDRNISQEVEGDQTIVASLR